MCSVGLLTAYEGLDEWYAQATTFYKEAQEQMLTIPFTNGVAQLKLLKTWLGFSPTKDQILYFWAV